MPTRLDKTGYKDQQATKWFRFPGDETGTLEVVLMVVDKRIVVDEIFFRAEAVGSVNSASFRKDRKSVV